MKNIQKTTLALIGLGAITAGSLAFAADTATPATTTTPTSKGALSWFGGEKNENRRGKGMGMMNTFLKTDLTDEQKTTLNDLQKSQRDEMKQFLEDNKEKMTETTTQDALKALRNKHAAAILPYIATDKQEAFKTMQQNAPVGMMGKGGKHGEKGGLGMMRGSDARSILPKAITDKLNTKLTAMTDNQAKLTWLQGVEAKIDTLTTKVHGQKTKRLLQEFKDLIGNKIDELSGNAVNETTLSKILD